MSLIKLSNNTKIASDTLQMHHITNNVLMYQASFPASGSYTATQDCWVHVSHGYGGTGFVLNDVVITEGFGYIFDIPLRKGDTIAPRQYGWSYIWVFAVE